MVTDKKVKVTVIGGGTGTYVVLSGLKQYPQLDLNAIVTVADSGGSTGRLRDEFGFQPVGDLRQGLAALATGDDTHIADLLLYRFEKGDGLKGHNLGNLILTALQDITGSTSQAVELASKIFNLRGHIYPITQENIELVIEYDDGKVILGEHILDEKKYGGKKIKDLKISPRAKIYEPAWNAITEADYVIIGPGDLYASILPNLVVDGIEAAFAETKAKIIYIANLMTRYSQTHDMSLTDHMEVIINKTKRPFDYVVINDQLIDEDVLRMYRAQSEFPVIKDIDTNDRTKVIEAPLLQTKIIKRTDSDTVPRSYLRHDSEKLAKLLNRYMV